MTESTGEVSTFVKGEKVSPVNILDQRVIGQGHYGTCYEADVNYRGRPRKFVIKRYTHDPNRALNADYNATRAIENYQILKKAGLRVFHTYRLGEDERSILMTDGNLESKICVDANPKGSLPALNLPKLTDVDDEIKKLAQAVFQQSRLAAEREVTLSKADIFFFLVDKNTKDIDFVLGDLDLVNFPSVPEFEQRLHENLENARSSIEWFILSNVRDTGNSYYRYVNDEFYPIYGKRNPFR